MESLVCLNGELMPLDQAKVPIWDRGFLFGDSVYEVCRIYQGACWQEEEHFGRLRRSLAEMSFPDFDFEQLVARVHRTITASGILEGTVYIQLTRGVAPRLHAFPDPPVPPTELILVREYDDGPTAAKRATGVPVISHPDLRWKRCDVKSTNLLANVLANQAAQSAGCYEAVLIDETGLVTEATHSSILWVRGERIGGTPEGPGILPGTTRHGLLGMAAAAGLEFEEGRITLEELVASDEVLLLGTTIEVLSIIAVDGRPISGGRPGPVSRKLQSAFQTAVARWLVPQPV